MTLATCGKAGCGWEVDFPSPAAADRGLAVHEHRLHDGPAVPDIGPGRPLRRPVNPLPQLASADWELRALDAIVQLATDKTEFTLFEIVEYGVGEPINPKNDWGGLARTAEHLQLIRQATHADGAQKFTRSQRPASKGSAVAVWTAGTGLPRYQRHRSHTA